MTHSSTSDNSIFDEHFSITNFLRSRRAGMCSVSSHIIVSHTLSSFLQPLALRHVSTVVTVLAQTFANVLSDTLEQLVPQVTSHHLSFSLLTSFFLFRLISYARLMRFWQCHNIESSFQHHLRFGLRHFLISNTFGFRILDHLYTSFHRYSTRWSVRYHEGCPKERECMAKWCTRLHTK